MPLITAFRWDTGVQVRVGPESLNVSAAVTNGTMSDPRTRDNNGGKQIAGRRPVAAERRARRSAARRRDGAYVADAALATATLLAGTARSTQHALGVDAEYSRDHWMLRGELIWNRWQVPTLVADARRRRARSSKGATRFRRACSWRAGSIGSASASCRRRSAPRTWDAPVTRLETGVGYYIRRNLLAKGTYQHNWRDGGLGHEPRAVRGATALLAVSVTRCCPLPSALCPLSWRSLICDSLRAGAGSGVIRGRVDVRRAPPHSRAAAERERSRHARQPRRRRTCAGRSSISNRRRRSRFPTPSRSARRWISGTRRSCRTCWRSPSARRSISRTATTRITTCSRCAAPRFDLGRYAAGPLEIGALRSPRHRPRVLRNPFAHERVHPRLQPSVLRGDVGRRPVSDRPRPSGPLHAGRVERRRDPRVARRSSSPRMAAPSKRISPCDSRVTILGSLTNRIFLASAALAVVSIGAAVYFVSRTTTREAEAELQRGLIEAGTLVDQQCATLVQTLTVMARLVADDPRLKAAVDTGDPPTVQPLAREYQEQLERGADGADRQDRARARRGRRCSTSPKARSATLPEIQQALAGREAGGFWPHADGVLQVMAVPITIWHGQRRRSWARSTVGFRLDNALAAQFKRATESDIAFAVDGQIRASTLPAADRAQLASLLKTGGVQTISLANGEYVALKRPLTPAAAAGSETRAERAAAPLAHRAAAVPRRHPHGPRRRRHDRRARGDDSQLRCCADDYAAARDDYGRDARDVGNRRSDAEDRAEPRGELGRRGRQAARVDVQHADRLDRALSARGGAARAAVGARPAVDRHRARDSEPADDHQGVAAHARQRAREPRRYAGRR